jgi:DnaJ-class molecular chaperone
MLNPYELLGVTIDTSKDDIKKIYYQLSLLAHPDKGGNNDDMITLKKAYDFVMKEINNINNTVTVEDLEKTFKDFCSTQENKVPMFQDIYAETFDLIKFNDYFAGRDSELLAGSIEGGYGNMMEQSTNNLEYKDIEAGSIQYQFTGLTEYKAPQESKVFQNLLDYTQKGPVDDYTLDTGGLHMSDYKDAFTINNQIKKKNTTNN